MTLRVESGKQAADGYPDGVGIFCSQLPALRLLRAPNVALLCAARAAQPDAGEISEETGNRQMISRTGEQESRGPADRRLKIAGFLLFD